MRAVIAVTGMAFEAKLVRGPGVDVVFAARADLLQRGLSEAVARGCSAIVSFGTAGGLGPDLQPGTLILADAVAGPVGRIETDRAWTGRFAAALENNPTNPAFRRGIIAGVAAPVTDEKAKDALFRATGALAVDMESHIAGAVATEQGVPFAVCRAIVDPAWRSLPRAAMAGLRDDGHTAVLPVLRELLREPSQLGALLQVAADARAARATLTNAMKAFRSAGVFGFP